MRKRDIESGSGGISLAGALTLIFVVLKLLKLINWSWVWVLSPIWISLGFALTLAILIAIGDAIFKD